MTSKARDESWARKQQDQLCSAQRRTVDPAMQVISDLDDNHLGEWGPKI